MPRLRHLLQPANDATKLRGWLVDLDQGGLTDGNVQPVITPPRPPAPRRGHPNKQLIDAPWTGTGSSSMPGELPWTTAPSRDSSRLYFFVVGH